MEKRLKESSIQHLTGWQRTKYKISIKDPNRKLLKRLSVFFAFRAPVFIPAIHSQCPKNEPIYKN
jgi:hypothetical protein